MLSGAGAGPCHRRRRHDHDRRAGRDRIQADRAAHVADEAGAAVDERPRPALLLFQVCDEGRIGLPLHKVARLEAFARDQDDPHLEPWRNYWRRVGKSDRTGIWHETFKVRAGEYEAVYGNMPAFGLAAAAGHAPVGRLKNSAAARIGASDADEPVVDPY